jgi:GAF domain-containing protein
MAGDSRERRLTAAFVTLADTLVAEYDVVDLLQTLVDSCAELLDAAAVGLVIADETGELSVVASTSERDQLVNLLQPPSGIGPSTDCYHSGLALSVPDIAAETRWPQFVADATAQGFGSLHAVPLRLRGTVIGAMSLYREAPGALGDDDASVVQGLADVATISVLHERALRESGIAKAQLQRALDSRVIIEQAKGVIAQTRSIDMDDAFRALRDYARNRGLNLRDVAELVVKRSITI